ncbi:MAG: tellurite resistance/C4-dicarboxylate transporter family protein [Candidatus Scalindua sp.]|jgi:tellurite resistance protein TehA-like permease|nr:tellurite resistance/C4-dicarboxylate transporter family protein [Candidatus Scalindua sp.]MDV5166245.1 tellurite resistance/C4-dicarboxylate transporter family protein [Candidatus Scalindua sp.]
MNPITKSIKGLHPAYFAMIMSTGIISIASKLLGFTGIAYGLFYINIIAYAIILPFQTIRVFAYWESLYKDLCNPKLSLVFFTTVAATNVLGAQFITIVNQPEVAKIFWYFGIFLWLAVSLVSFSVLFIKCEEGPESVIHGGWLISAVGTHSVAVLGAALATSFGDYGSFVLFSSIVWWLIGSFLYVILITLLFYRLVFFKLVPEALIPPYWINMGAIAITTLAGSIICLTIPKIGGPFAEILTFTKGFTLFFWSFGTWWIPLLVILGFWKFVIRKQQFKYTPLDWGMVFPLGMYTACTYKLSQAIEMPFVANISTYFIYLAYIAWTVIFVSMLISIFKAATAKEVATK